MSNKIKTAVFSVSFWKDEKHPYYDDWRKCVDKNINYDYLFTCPGSYSDPKIMENEIDVIQIGVENDLPYSRDWNYWHVGFRTALVHLLLNIKDFDIAIHVQDSLLLNMNLDSYIQEFYERDDILASPQYLSEGGLSIETSFMMLKKEAIKKYINSPLRPSLSKQQVINVEEEAFYMFKDKWWNFIPEVPTIRKNDFILLEPTQGESPFKLTEETFLNLPLISTSTSFTKEEDVKKWKEFNNI
jgi:hypothetical protein